MVSRSPRSGSGCLAVPCTAWVTPVHLPGRVLEVAFGHFDEDDIKRLRGRLRPIARLGREVTTTSEEASVDRPTLPPTGAPVVDVTHSVPRVTARRTTRFPSRRRSTEGAVTFFPPGDYACATLTVRRASAPRRRELRDVLLRARCVPVGLPPGDREPDRPARLPRTPPSSSGRSGAKRVIIEDLAMDGNNAGQDRGHAPVMEISDSPEAEDTQWVVSRCHVQGRNAPHGRGWGRAGSNIYIGAGRMACHVTDSRQHVRQPSRARDQRCGHGGGPLHRRRQRRPRHRHRCVGNRSHTCVLDLQQQSTGSTSPTPDPVPRNGSLLSSNGIDRQPQPRHRGRRRRRELARRGSRS